MVKLEARVIEYIHDEMVPALLPFDEMVSAHETRNHHLIESAAGRPFHTIGGIDLWPEMAQKAAALFHALACNHCFVNGNKRTAVLALDLFLTSNSYLLLLNSDEVYALARRTARANEQGRNLDEFMAELAQAIEQASYSVQDLDLEDLKGRLEHCPGYGMEKALESIVRVFQVAAIENSEKTMG